MEISLENLLLDIGAKGLKTPIILALTYLYCTCIRVFTLISSAPPLEKLWGNPLPPALSESSLY